ncbi:hypothetical protein FQN49_007314 [Arthroderma sp. PD_2]|nr:hypothetical protein FQN49_007314 [Arthroderma sp. PD_2]
MDKSQDQKPEAHIPQEHCMPSTKVPIIVGDPGQTYVLVMPDVGRAFQAASLCHTEPTTLSTGGSSDDTCKVTFFHDSQHFGLGPSSYPQLRIPSNFPRQTDSNTSPATIHLTGKMHDMVLDGTPDAQFAEMSNTSARTLHDALEKLKHM